MRIFLRGLLAFPVLMVFMTACTQQEADAPVVEEAAAPVAEAPPIGEIIEEALSAAPESMVDTVTVADWAGNVLKEGTSAYTGCSLEKHCGA